MVHHLPGVRFLLIISCLAIIGLAAACGGAEPPPPQPTTAPTAMPEPTTPPEVQGIAPTKAGEMAATAEPAPTSAPSESVSGKDVVRAVIPVEPDKLSPWQTGSAETGSIVGRACGGAEPPPPQPTTVARLGLPGYPDARLRSHHRYNRLGTDGAGQVASYFAGRGEVP